MQISWSSDAKLRDKSKKHFSILYCFGSIAFNNDIICPYSLMRGEGSLDSRFVHLDTSYQHQDTEDTGRLDPRYRWLEWRDGGLVTAVWLLAWFLSVSESAAPDWEQPRARGNILEAQFTYRQCIHHIILQTVPTYNTALFLATATHRHVKRNQCLMRFGFQRFVRPPISEDLCQQASKLQEEKAFWLSVLNI